MKCIRGTGFPQGSMLLWVPGSARPKIHFLSFSFFSCWKGASPSRAVTWYRFLFPLLHFPRVSTRVIGVGLAGLCPQPCLVVLVTLGCRVLKVVFCSAVREAKACVVPIPLWREQCSCWPRNLLELICLSLQTKNKPGCSMYVFLRCVRALFFSWQLRSLQLCSHRLFWDLESYFVF